ncbi:MAG: 5'/3'-nucleotidase SurE [Negativicutes bacterium]|nr:5'/3'-nucleotidase SurE [Negativicutes bacterium]
MHILLCNDDGISAPGIAALWEALLPLAEKITVFAPDSERSAAGHALTISRPLTARRVTVSANDKIVAYAVNGTPADCVKVAVEGMGIRPDLVISGINNGPNVGHDTLYSGTVAAAREGALLGMPAIAVSLAFFDRESRWRDYRPAGEFAARVAEKLAEERLPAGVVLNINVPDVAEKCLRGIRFPRVGELGYTEPLEPAGDDGHTFQICGRAFDRGNNPDNDVTAVMNGYISITPLTVNQTDYAFLNELRQRGFRC